MSIEFGTGGLGRDEDHAPDQSPPQPAETRRRPWVPVVIALTLVAGIAVGIVLGLTLGGDDAEAAPQTSITTTTTTAAPDVATTQASASGLQAFGSVAVDGALVPQLTEAGDPYVGVPLPTVSGSDLSGEPVTIDMADGRAKLVMFVAHWCPHCQTEIPGVRSWLATSPLPDNVDFYAVATFTDAARGNFPPGDWFEREGWQWPVMVDDQASTAATAYGVNAVPFWMLVHTDGTLAARGPAQLPPQTLTDIVEQLSQGPDFVPEPTDG